VRSPVGPTSVLGSALIAHRPWAARRGGDAMRGSG
jgi:hypothetical protein